MPVRQVLSHRIASSAIGGDRVTGEDETVACRSSNVADMASMVRVGGDVKAASSWSATRLRVAFRHRSAVRAMSVERMRGKRSVGVRAMFS